MSNALSPPSGDHGTSRIPSILSASHLSDSEILPMFAELVLIAVPYSVTTTASDAEFSIPTNTPGWNRGSHFPPLAGLAGMYRIFSPNSRIGVVPSTMQPLQRRLSVAADVTPASIASLRQVGFWFPCDAPTQLSMFWPDRQRVLPHVR